MRAQPTIIVFIIACICVATAMLVNRSGNTESQIRKLRGRILEAERLSVESIDRIELIRRDRAPLVFERSGQLWRQVEPFFYPMDAYSIRQLILLASDLQGERLAPDALNNNRSKADLSLDPPQATIEYHWPRGNITIKFGRFGVAGLAYLQLDDDPSIYVVNQALHDRAINMNPKEWRDRRLFDAVSVDADQIEMAAGQRRVVLARQRREWRLVEPIRARIDPLQRDDLFQAIAKAQCNGFIMDQPEDLTKFGLADPLLTVTVTTSRPIELEGEIVREPMVQRLRVGLPVGSSSRDRFALIEGRPVVVQVPEAALNALFRRAERLVDPTASGVQKADVKSIRISTDDSELLLERNLDRWIAPELDDAEVSPDFVNHLLVQLTDLRSSEIRIQDYPYDMQKAMITFLGYDSRPIDTVRIIHDPQTGKWALENGDGVLRWFSANFSLPLHPEDFGLSTSTATAGAPTSAERNTD